MGAGLQNIRGLWAGRRPSGARVPQDACVLAQANRYRPRCHSSGLEEGVLCVGSFLNA